MLCSDGACSNMVFIESNHLVLALVSYVVHTQCDAVLAHQPVLCARAYDFCACWQFRGPT